LLWRVVVVEGHRDDLGKQGALRVLMERGD
jgi:hypothetical protein